ncbi:MAG: hypothetical protein ABIV47_14410 [Roseiflexaceae bacterium]
MPGQTYRQRLRSNYGLSFAISAALCAAPGWLVLATMIVIVNRRLLHNEDSEAIIYLLGIPLLVGISFWVVARLNQTLYAQLVPKQFLLRGTLIAPILFYILERAMVFFLARGSVLSDIQWVSALAFLWILTIVVCGTLLSWMKPKSVVSDHIRT